MDISLAPQVLGYIAGFPITNTFWVTIAISLFLIIGAFILRARLKKVPGKTQLFLETFVMFCYDFVSNMIDPKSKAFKYMFALFTTLALFFLIANLIPFIPGLGAITYNELPLFRVATSDYALIFTITVVIFVLLQTTAFVKLGAWGYFNKFINLKALFKGKILDFFLGILDIIGELAKVVSLSFRLFGNMFGGEVLGIILMSGLGYVRFGAPIITNLLGLLVAVIQAFVFAILVLIYFQMALAEGSEEA